MNSVVVERLEEAFLDLFFLLLSLVFLVVDLLVSFPDLTEGKLSIKASILAFLDFFFLVLSLRLVDFFFLLLIFLLLLKTAL